MPTIVPPGPKGIPIIGTALEWQKDPVSFFLKNDKEFPEISRMPVAGMHFVQLTNPDYIQQVFQSNSKNYKKDKFLDEVRFLLGNGLLTSEGSFWLKQRRLIQPIFHRERLMSFIDCMSANTKQMLDEWDQLRKQPFDIYPEMLKLTLNIISQTMLSADVKKDTENVATAMAALTSGIHKKIRSIVKFPYWIPTTQNRTLKKHRQTLNDLILGIIEQRRISTKRFDDLLEMLIEVEDADSKERMTDHQLRVEVLTIFVAGHETTSTALTFILYLISEHPEIQQLLKEEADEVLKGALPSLTNINKLQYTQQVIKEGLRLYPPAWALGREAINDDIIGGYKIFKGDNIIILPYGLHRSKRLWEQPEKFDPDRFSPERSANHHRFQYLPFGGGPRICIGNNFAMMEMKVVLVMIAQRFHLTHEEHHKVELDHQITLRPKNGMVMNVGNA